MVGRMKVICEKVSCCHEHKMTSYSIRNAFEKLKVCNETVLGSTVTLLLGSPCGDSVRNLIRMVTQAPLVAIYKDFISLIGVLTILFSFLCHFD